MNVINVCRALNIRVSTVSDEDVKIPGVNTWEFSFVVKDEESSEALLQTMVFLDQFRFRSIESALAEKATFNPQFIWDQTMINACLNANLGHLKPEEQGPKLTLN